LEKRTNYKRDGKSKEENIHMAVQQVRHNPDLSIIQGGVEKSYQQIRVLPKLCDNLQQIWGSLFDEIADRAENALTLDQRIDAFSQWSDSESSEDLSDMIRMQKERDTDDYSEPGTWYGCIRKWQGLNEAEALANFRTGWQEGGEECSQNELKAFYSFLQKYPLPPLSAREKIDLYDRRIMPACLKDLFKKMEEEGFTSIFEETYEYSHSEPWTICNEDFYNIREALHSIRGDALESFILVSSQVLAEKKAQQISRPRIDPATLQEVERSEKAWSLSTSQAVYKVVERAMLSQVPSERLAFMLQHVNNYPSEANKHAEYISLLERLVNEQNGDYNDPVTAYGCLKRFRSMSEDEFIAHLESFALGSSNRQMPERKRREAYRHMLAIDLPQLPKDEHEALYSLGTTQTPTQKLIMENLLEPAGELLFEYCGERKNYNAFEDPSWITEEILEPLLNLSPDIINTILKTVFQSGFVL
jgi:hypothetical protein